MEEKFQAVAAAEIIRNFGYWQQQALLRPLVVTHHGRARVMLISTDDFEALATADTAAPAVPADDAPLATVLANSAHGFLLVDAGLVIRDANQTALDWFGMTLESVKDRPLREAFGDRHNPLLESMLRSVIRSGEALSYEITGASTSGLHLQARSFPFGMQVATVFVDITEQERLRDETELLEAAQTGLGLMNEVGTLEIDGEGRIAAADSAFEFLTGLRAGDLHGAKLAGLLDRAGQGALERSLAAALAGQTPALVSARLHDLSGRPQAVSLSLAPLKRGLAVTGAIVAVVPGETVMAETAPEAR